MAMDMQREALRSYTSPFLTFAALKFGTYILLTGLCKEERWSQVLQFRSLLQESVLCCRTASSASLQEPRVTQRHHGQLLWSAEARGRQVRRIHVSSTPNLAVHIECQMFRHAAQNTTSQCAPMQ
jgi:hypothetical protein